VYSLIETGEGLTNPLAIMIALFAQGIPGNVDRVERICRTIHGQLSGPPGFAHACYYLLLSGVNIYRGDFDAADQHAELAESLAKASGRVSVILAALRTTVAFTHASRANWQAVNEAAAWGGNEAIYGQIARNWKLHSLHFQARAAFHSGNFEGLKQIYDLAMAHNAVEAPASVPYRHVIRGMMRLAEKAYAQAEQAFRDAVRDEEIYKVSMTVVSGRVFLAYALLTRGRTDEAMSEFTPYIAQCEANHVPGYLMYHNPIIQPLLRQAYERNVHRAFAETVLDALGAPLNPMVATGGEPLSDREMEVLLVMAEGLANREIGERLFVSEATVKTHVQRILRKLDAASRTQAVARARELMLI
jgi:LuxR family maltose regulon positive regulatory protein